MLILPIKKKWFDKIQSGEKKEEYREIKPYYTTRFRNVLHIPKPVSDNAFFERMRRPHNAFKVCFRKKPIIHSNGFFIHWNRQRGMGRRTRKGILCVKDFRNLGGERG